MKQNKRRRDIKSKLIAAICMLMVSTIMMVSTTYAWFTLSTAPEVTGINTSVGANGNLEMALLPPSGDANSIQSGVGTSMDIVDATLANITWGNLVDLTPTSYGLDQIKLMPAAVNMSYDSSTDTYSLAVGSEGGADDSLLKTPSYGADGRVTTLDANTLANGASETGFLAPGADSTIYGVRGVGTASDMTDRQLAYRNYRASASTAGVSAANMAKAALKNNGEVIAQMAITHAVGSDKYYQSDVDALQAVVDAFLGTETTEGALDYLESAMKDSILAAIASKAAAGTEENPGLDDTAAMGLINNYAQDTVTLATMMDSDELESVIGTLPSLSTMYEAYKGMVSDMEAAQTAINALTINNAGTADDASDDYYEWGSATTGIRSVVGYFADPDLLTVNGYETGELMENLGPFATSAVNGIDVIVPSGAGIFADIADFCGDYDAMITIRVTYEEMGIVDAPFDATMYAVTDQDPPYLSGLSTTVGTLGAPDAVTSTDSKISDLYGFAIDLAFRTNAASGAKLQLQTEAIDRIYSDNTTDDSTGTLGGGSTVSFMGTTTSFGETQIVNLMDAVNVLFYDTFTGEIYGVAKLDTGSTTTEAEGETEATTTKNYTYDEATNTVTADLYLVAFSVDTTNNANAVTNGVWTFGDKLEDASLLTLTQNQEATISVLVYLDGNQVENEDVANGTTSVTGTLNLQFSTDATLDPMDYTPLDVSAASGN